jgi:hypothetical protein
MKFLYLLAINVSATITAVRINNKIVGTPAKNGPNGNPRDTVVPLSPLPTTPTTPAPITEEPESPIPQTVTSRPKSGGSSDQATLFLMGISIMILF